MSAHASAAVSATFPVEGDYRFTARNFQTIAGFLREETGIALTESKAALVYSRLAKRLRKLGVADFDAYCALIDGPDGAGERKQAIAALTTNVTRFYREPHHFDYLRRELAPKLAETARRGGRVRLWSAACSSGEEAYSIAMTLLDVFAEAPSHDVKILATDIDPNVIARGKAGVYSDGAVAPIPASARERWLTRHDENGENAWRVRDELRALVAFKELNLVGSWPMRGRFDAIFCRNVAIYFNDDTQAFLWGRLRDVLTPDGRLFIGHSERIEVSGFESAGLTIYKQAGAR